MSGSWALLTEILFWLPSGIVSLVAMIVAMARWRQHPGVSTLVLASVGILMLVSVCQRIGSEVVIQYTLGAGQDFDSIGIYLGIIALVALPIRAAAWATLLVALFGWRKGPAVFQFSIRNLMIATFGVAVLCAIGRAIVGLLGESATVLLNVLDEVPIVALWLIGLWLAIARWSHHPAVSKAAIWGFSLSLAATVSWLASFVWIVTTENFYQPQLLYLIHIGTAVVSVTGWALVLVATLGWRSSAETPITNSTSPRPSATECPPRSAPADSG